MPRAPMVSPSLKERGVVAVALLFLAFLLAFPAHAQSFPALTGRVVDQAKLLSPDQAAALDANARSVNTRAAARAAAMTIAPRAGIFMSPPTKTCGESNRPTAGS